MSLIVERLTRKDFKGDPSTGQQSVINHVFPIFWRGFYEEWQKGSEAALMKLPEFIGLPTRQFEKSQPRSAQLFKQWKERSRVDDEFNRYGVRLSGIRRQAGRKELRSETEQSKLEAALTDRLEQSGEMLLQSKLYQEGDEQKKAFLLRELQRRIRGGVVRLSPEELELSWRRPVQKKQNKMRHSRQRRMLQKLK